MDTHRDSATLEREVEQQRQRVEDRIGEIKERLSPGQLVDEVLSYGKQGGQQFATNMGTTIANNPLPAALLGISLVWLMSGQGKQAPVANATNTSIWDDDVEYPYATVSSGLRRIRHAADDNGKWHSEFEDGTGRRFKAEADELGHRAGHFVDDAGRQIGGFIDEAGHRVRDFQDEAGNRLGDAMGWASHRFSDVERGVSDHLGHVAKHAQNLGGTAQAQADRTSQVIVDAFQNQPLVAGALAFAAGAALGAALPHTSQEDATVGDLADKVRGKAAEAASDLYEEGKSRVADLYEKGKEGAGVLIEDLKQAAAPAADLN